MNYTPEAQADLVAAIYRAPTLTRCARLLLVAQQHLDRKDPVAALMKMSQIADICNRLMQSKITFEGN